MVELAKALAYYKRVVPNKEVQQELVQMFGQCEGRVDLSQRAYQQIRNCTTRQSDHRNCIRVTSCTRADCERLAEFTVWTFVAHAANSGLSASELLASDDAAYVLSTVTRRRRDLSEVVRAVLRMKDVCGAPNTEHTKACWDARIHLHATVSMLLLRRRK